MGLLMQESYAAIYVAPTPFNGVKPAWGSVTSALCFLKGITVNARVNSKDAGGGCGLTKNRYGKDEKSLDIQGLVHGGGFVYRNVGGIIPIRYPILVVTRPLSALAASDIWEGVITEWSWEMSDDEPQAEKIKIDLNPDW